MKRPIFLGVGYALAVSGVAKNIHDLNGSYRLVDVKTAEFYSRVNVYEI